MASRSLSTSLDAERINQDIELAISDISNPRARSRAQNMAYLLGATQEMPAPTQQEINQLRAVRACYDAMSGMDPVLDNRDQSPAVLSDTENFSFQIPINTTNPNVTTTCLEVSFAVGDPREDIFSRICAYMDVPREYGKLGWRLNSARRSDPPHRFLTSQDVDVAFKEAQRAQEAGRRKKKVVIEIVNTHPAMAKKRPTGKLPPLMVPYTGELELVKKKVRCNEHRGNNRWCWVDPNNNDHISLCLNDLQIWAKALYEEPGDLSCISPPNGLITDIRKSRKPLGSSPLTCIPTEPVIPIIHNHVHILTPNNSASPLQPCDNTLPSGRARITRQYAMYLESDGESDDDEDQYDIKKILDQLHTKYPAVNFSRYEQSLRMLGICYLVTADMFDAEFYVREVKMVYGAAHLFKEYVSQQLGKVVQAKERRKAKGKKKARVDNEDIDVSLAPA